VDLVPVVLFVYNRPEHTLKVLEALKQNNIEKLYIFSDGPKLEADLEKVKKVRDIVSNINWCNVEYEFAEKNRGLADSIIYGVSKVFNVGYDKLVVLEDDCVPSPNFMKFMREAFDFYEDYDNVMHISGFGLPLKKHTKSDVYFTPYPCSWGWGTWRKYWESCNFYQYENYKFLLQNESMRRKFNYAGEAFSEFLEMQLKGQINSWLIRWYFHLFQNNGLAVWSYNSYINNKGFDGSGVHSNKIDRFNQKLVSHKDDNEKIVFEENVVVNEVLIKEFRRYFMGKKLSERMKTILYLIKRKMEMKLKWGER
jgi:Glycosyl transferase family 2